jgi:hypothetical protein
MPENCNTLRLIDENQNFSKENCEWFFTKKGRPVKIGRKQKDKNPNNKILCVTIDKTTYELMKRRSIEQTNKEKIQITVNELIRNALQKAFPDEKI